ncbi:unnamed protein product [Linum trigynum]|uniref:RING-type E3 ubiquitin transferase n=2 Tax=Linum trigynum TaxID=586398 RepID=A0AAV2GGV4_9ROSI
MKNAMIFSLFLLTINTLAAAVAAEQPHRQQDPPQPSQCPSQTSSSFCGSTGVTVRFPFWIRSTQHPDRCRGYEGFDLTCGPNGQTLITLSLETAPFVVHGVDYSTQELWVNDPGDCLPGRLLSLNFSTSSSPSPFRGLYGQTYTFFNCSGDYSSYPGMNPIACLSGGGWGRGEYSVFASSSERAIAGLRRRPSCRVVAAVEVPVEWPFYEQVMSSDLSADLRLTWDSPDCRRCVVRGGRCGLKGSDGGIGCFDVTQGRRGLPAPARYAITIGVGIPLFLFSLGALCCICRRVKRCATTPPPTSSSSAAADYQHNLRQLHLSVAAAAPPTPISSGLDRKTIESYPKIVLGESRRLPKPDENTCAICLSDYCPKETLKTIPDCGHCFHAECIDEWLKLKGNCPICRNSPEPVVSFAVPVQAWS